jgi:hypothetical protein
MAKSEGWTMPTPYRHFPAVNLGQLADAIISTSLQAPKFNFLEAYFPRRSIDQAMQDLNESIDNLRPQLDGGLYESLLQMSDQMRACFKADPENKTGETRRGKELAQHMAALVDARMLAREVPGDE